jgi:hypothetical protein
MLMLSFIFMIAFDLFEWKRICAGFITVCLDMYCWWRTSYQEGRVGIPLTWLTLPHFLCMSLDRTWIFNVGSYGIVCVQFAQLL